MSEKLPAVAAGPGPIVPEDDWSVIDHVCGECFGRLLGRHKDGERFYRCANCGRETPAGAKPIARTPEPGGKWSPAICACHMKFGRRNAGVRCIVNDKRGPASPTEIVARQIL